MKRFTSASVYRRCGEIVKVSGRYGACHQLSSVADDWPGHPYNRAMPSTPAGVPAGAVPVAHAAFVLTGVVTTLLGPLLPVLLVRWSLDDAVSG